MRIALMAGISGKAGKEAMEALLNSRNYGKLTVLTRRDNKRLKNIHLKKVNVDFSLLHENRTDFEGIDDVFCLLGSDYISTKDIEDIDKFDFEYPLQMAKVAKDAGVRNFYLLNSASASLNSPNEKLKQRARLESEIDKLGFENFVVFKVNRIGNSINMSGGGYALRKSMGTILNIVGFGLVNKIKSSPANLLARKMIDTAVIPNNGKQIFLPKDL